MSRRALTLVVVMLVSVGALAPLAAPPANAQAQTTLDVLVVDDTGDRLAGATVEASWSGGSAAKETPTNGTVSFAVPSGERVLLSVSHPEFAGDETAVVSDTDERASVEFRTTGRLAVTVSGDGERLSNARVALADEDEVVARGRTGDDGRFTTDTVPQGEYELTVSRTGYAGASERVSVYGRATVSVQLRRGSIDLEVTVVDDYYDPPRPVGDATVTYGGFDGDTTTGNGVARLLVPLNSRAPVTAKKEGYATTETLVSVEERPRSVTVNVSRTPALDATLSTTRVDAGDSIGVQVRNAYDDPAPGVSVALDGEVVAETDDDGEATVTVPAGEHTLRLAANGTETTRSVVGVATETPSPTATPTATSTASPTPTSTETTGPGFGPLAALAALTVALLATGLAASRR